jgi:electron transport complex protein RnfC
MVRLKEHKHSTESKPIERLIALPKVYIPLQQHIGKLCEPEVKPGDSVLIGQRIASVKVHVFANIHASVSGKVMAIQEWPHPVLGRSKTIVIENDGQEKTVGFSIRSEAQSEALSTDQIRSLIFDAGVVGMGGASFPTHIKLNPPKPVDTLIVNGAECEPYLTGDYRLMVEHADEILKGIRLAAKCLKVADIIIAIEDNKPEAIREFRAKSAGIKVKVLPSTYPQGGEKQLIRRLLDKEIPRGKLPFDVGVVVHNVATVYAIYEAVYKNKPLYERVVTVTGGLIAKPKNLLVRIGTPINELIEYCSGSKSDMAKIISGGPMMGLAQYSMDAPVIKSTNGVLCLSKDEVKRFEESPCIRCGACIKECPAGLMPTMISLNSKKEIWQLA